MLLGNIFTFKDCSFVLNKNKELCTLGKKNNEPIYLRIDYDFTDFIKCCEEIDPKEILIMNANITLNKYKGN